MKINVILSLVAIVMIGVVVVFVLIGQQSTLKVHRPSQADSAFANLRAQ